MRELRFERSGRLGWHERDVPALREPGDAIVRPFAAAHSASTVDYVDDDAERCSIAASFGARVRSRQAGGYDVAVEATSRPAGLRRAMRALAPGGVCTAVGYYLGSGTRVPLMRMYATDATLRVGVSHSRAVLPRMLDFVQRAGFPAERVTTLDAPWDEAPAAYAAKTAKLVLRRDPLTREETP